MAMEVAMNLKNKIFKKYIKCKEPLLKEQLGRDFKAIKSELTWLSRQCKKDYDNQYFTENKENLQKKSGKAKKKLLILNPKTSQAICILENHKTLI